MSKVTELMERNFKHYHFTGVMLNCSPQLAHLAKAEDFVMSKMWIIGMN